MRITEDVRRYAAEQGLSEEAAVKQGLQAKAAEFVEKESEVYAKT
jgi:phosphomethylpyrimidine synthase